MTDGALPAGTAPLTPVDGDFDYEVIAAGALDDALFYDLRITGTNTSGVAVSPGVAWTSSAPSGVMAKWVLSASLERRAGASSSARLRILELGAGGNILSGGGSQAIAPDLAPDLYALEVATSNGDVTAVRGQFEFASVAPGGFLDVTYRVMRQQLQPDHLTAWIPTGPVRSVEQTNTMTAVPGLLRRSAVTVPASVRRATARRLMKDQAPLGSVTIFLALVAMRALALGSATLSRQVVRFMSVQGVAMGEAARGALGVAKALLAESQAAGALIRGLVWARSGTAGAIATLDRSLDRRLQVSAAAIAAWRRDIARTLYPAVAGALAMRSLAVSKSAATDQAPVGSVRRLTSMRRLWSAAVAASRRLAMTQDLHGEAAGVGSHSTSATRALAPAVAAAVASLARTATRNLSRALAGAAWLSRAVAVRRSVGVMVISSAIRALMRRGQAASAAVASATRGVGRALAARAELTAMAGRATSRVISAVGVVLARRASDLAGKVAAAASAMATTARSVGITGMGMAPILAVARRGLARSLVASSSMVAAISRSAAITRLTLQATAGAAARMVIRWGGLIRRRAAVMVRTWRS